MSGSLPDRSLRHTKGGNHVRNLRKYLVGLSTATLVLGSVATGLPVNAASAGSAPFSDIAGNSHAAAITFLSTIGVVNGVGGGLYDPSAPVTREQMAKIVVNLMGKGNVAAALQNETPSFTDASSIDTWAWGYVNVAADMGIINGFPDGSFQPLAPVTDVQAAAMLIRAIGDQNQVVGTWPGNYVAAAFNLGINTGISSFVANLPATRGDVAQMAYEAAVNAPVYTATTTNNITSYAKGPSLYENGAVNGNQVFTGTVTGVSQTNITWSNTMSSTVNGVTTTSTSSTSKNWASSYQLAGVGTLSSLIGETVVVNVDSSGNVNFLTLAPNQSTSTNTGTLANTSTAIPSGFFQVNSNLPWLVTNTYSCSNPGNGSNNQTPNTTCQGDYYLLLGGTTPTTVQLSTYATPTAGASGTTYEVNPSSDGSDLGVIPATVSGITYLSENDTVSYTLNNSKVSNLVEQNVNDQIGLVTSTWCASGCDNSINAAATPQIQVTINGTNYVVNVQPYTQLTLNGASATLSKSLDNTVAYVSTPGGYGTNTSGSANPGTGDNNAVTIALFQNQVTGTVTAVNTSSSAPNISGGNTNQVTSFTMSLTNGSSETYTADANFVSSNLVVGASVTVALDQAGEARQVISTSATTTPTVALVIGTGSAATLSGTTDTISVQDPSGSQTFNLGAHTSTQPTPYPSTVPCNTAGCLSVYSSTYNNGPVNGQNNGNNGAILFITNSAGQAVNPTVSSGAVVPGSGLPTGMTLETPQAYFNNSNIPTTDHWAVVSTTSSSVVIGLYNSSNNIDTVGGQIPNPYVSVVAGAAFAGSTGDNLGFSGLNSGSTDNVSLWQANINGQNYYAVVALTQ